MALLCIVMRALDTNLSLYNLCQVVARALHASNSLNVVMCKQSLYVYIYFFVFNNLQITFVSPLVYYHDITKIIIK